MTIKVSPFENILNCIAVKHVMRDRERGGEEMKWKVYETQSLTQSAFTCFKLNLLKCIEV